MIYSDGSIALVTGYMTKKRESNVKKIKQTLAFKNIYSKRDMPLNNNIHIYVALSNKR